MSEATRGTQRPAPPPRKHERVTERVLPAVDALRGGAPRTPRTLKAVLAEVRRRRATPSA